MHLKGGKSYTNDNSDIALRILKVQYRSDEYTKVKAMCYNKRNKIIYDTKNYKLIHSRIQDWYVIKNDGDYYECV